MPRGTRKPMNYDEEILKTQAKITMHTNSIAELKNHLRQLGEEKEQQELRALGAAVRNSGRSIEEILASIT